MVLENHLNKDLGKTNITLLAGEAILFNPTTQKNQSLILNEPVRLGIGTHKVCGCISVFEVTCYLFSRSRVSAQYSMTVLCEKKVAKTPKIDYLYAELLLSAIW